MELIAQFWDLFMHIDQHLKVLVESYGAWLYLILIVIVFCETGLVVTPFLPGDSLLFAAGALAAMGLLNIWILLSTLLIAAIVGDAVNYRIGRKIGVKPFKEDARIFKLKYLHKTEEFYEKHGGKTIIIARFVPIVRTFAPFIAGASSMNYRRFFHFNVIGALLWTISMLGGGYLLGQLPWVSENFSLIALMIIFISLLPILFELLKSRLAKRDEVA